MSTALHIEAAHPQDAAEIKAIQDSWLGTRVGSEGFLTNAETLARIAEMIESGNILVARQAGEIVAYATFYRRSEWETLYPGYTDGLKFKTDTLRAEYAAVDYVVIDHMARRRSYTGSAAVRIVMHLKRMMGEWGIGYFLGEISPENDRSAAFFMTTLRAEHIATTSRNSIPWDIYAARI